MRLGLVHILGAANRDQPCASEPVLDQGHHIGNLKCIAVDEHDQITRLRLLGDLHCHVIELARMRAALVEDAGEIFSVRGIDVLER